MEDNSVLNEDSNYEEALVATRKSLSQPSLAVVEEIAKIESNSTSLKPGMTNAFSSTNVRSIPIIKTWHENEELKGKIYIMRSEVQMHERRYLEAKEACHKSVQDVLDEYVELKLGREEFETKISRFNMMEKELQKLQLELNNSRDSFARQAEDFKKQKHIMEQRIKELELPISDANNTTMGSFRGTLDDILKKDDPDFTLASGYEERKISELETKLRTEMDKVEELENHILSLRQEIDDQSARLADSENIRAQLEAAAGRGIFGAGANTVPNSTFVIGNARESQTEEQLKYIDELEKKLTEANNESDKVRLALVEYMNRCSKLENEIRKLKKNLNFDSSSILTGGKTPDELNAQINQVTSELNELREENRKLRIRCDQLNGGDGNLSVSQGHSRLMAGISSDELDSSHNENQACGTSIINLPHDRQSDYLEESKLPLMDSSAAELNKQEFDAAWEYFQSEKNRLQNIPHDTLESSLNSSMPPPDRDATQSFLSQKGFKNSPLFPQKSKFINLKNEHPDPATPEQIKNASFSSNAASPHCRLPLVHDMQQILDSSAIVLEGQNEVAANVEKMHVKMTQIREVLARLFERLKSSAALFEEILEKMGSKSELADRIREMKLAFETSMCDHADMSVVLEAAENELNNMSVNFSILEKSAINHSFVADISRRFTIAPDAEAVASSSLLNASYSPIFNFSDNAAQIEKLQNQISELKSELEKARVRDLRSSQQNSPSRLSDVQLRAAQNFEELEVCQATLKKVEAEKISLANEIVELESSHYILTSKLDEARHELEKVINRCESEQEARLQAERALDETRNLMAQVKNDVSQQAEVIKMEIENRLAEAHKQVDEKNAALIKSLEVELKNAVTDRFTAENQLGELAEEMDRLRKRTREAENKVEQAADEKQDMIEKIVHLENKLEQVAVFEKESTDCMGKMTAKKREIELVKQRDEIENITFEGLERIRNELTELTKKESKSQFIKGNASSIQVVCDELCRRISQQRERHHEGAESMKKVNSKIVEYKKEIDELRKEIQMIHSNKENESPNKKSSNAALGTLKQKSSNFTSPTRQLLHESTMAVDAIVQKLKKTHSIFGMSAELKDAIANLINESRTLRDFLHQKLILFKGIDMKNWKNDTVEQLVEKLEQFNQDNLILQEEIKKYKKELKQMKTSIPSLGADVQESIKREIGKIAEDMGAVKELRKK